MNSRPVRRWVRSAQRCRCFRWSQVEVEKWTGLLCFGLGGGGSAGVSGCLWVSLGVSGSGRPWMPPPRKARNGGFPNPGLALWSNIWNLEVVFSLGNQPISWNLGVSLPSRLRRSGGPQNSPNSSKKFGGRDRRYYGECAESPWAPQHGQK